MNCPDCNHPADSHNEMGCFHDDGRPCLCMTSREFILFPEEYGGITTDLLKGKTYEFSKLKAEIELLVIKVDRYEDALQELAGWVRAYPLDIFPEPDLKRAHELLQVGGMSIDVVSASAMRYLLVHVQEIVQKARGEA